MKKLKLIKALVLGLCLSVLSTGVAFAESGGGETGEMKIQITSSDDSLNQKQREIDQYIFEEHKKDIEDMGFTVTNTGVVDDYVEVGITPFNQKNADYLYEALGKDNVKIVEGIQSEIMETQILSDEKAETAAIADTSDVPETTAELETTADAYTSEIAETTVAADTDTTANEDASKIAESTVVSDTTVDTDTTSPINKMVYVVVTVVLLGGILIMILKSKTRKR